MVGPSSSHTAGAVRLGALARAIAGHAITSATVTLHGSFATTGRGHGTDLAITAGLLGLAPDDPGVPFADALARKAGMTVEFSEGDLGEVHPNTAAIAITTDTGERLEVWGSSVGAGDVEVIQIDDFAVRLTGDLPTLGVIHLDRPGVIASVSATLAAEGINIASMQVFREKRGARALMLIETDGPVPAVTAGHIGTLGGVLGVRVIPAV